MTTFKTIACAAAAALLLTGGAFADPLEPTGNGQQQFQTNVRDADVNTGSLANTAKDLKNADALQDVEITADNAVAPESLTDKATVPASAPSSAAQQSDEYEH